MKKVLVVFGMFLSAVTALGSESELYKQSYVSLNKGDCKIENANDFAPAIESFKILVSSDSLQSGSGKGFVSYNMLGTTVGVMVPANLEGESILNTQVTADILIGFSSQAQLTLQITGASGWNKPVGEVTIVRDGRKFSSRFACD
jgi:hypothetical protein